MKKKAKSGKVTAARKRSASKDLSARRAGAVKGGLLPAVKPMGSSKVLADGSVRFLGSSISNLGT